MKAEQVKTKDEIIRELSEHSDRYGSLLALMERWGARSLREITTEQAQQFWNENKTLREVVNK